MAALLFIDRISFKASIYEKNRCFSFCLYLWYNDCARRNPDREPRPALQGAILTGITANIIGVKCKYERTDTAIQATAEVP